MISMNQKHVLLAVGALGAGLAYRPLKTRFDAWNLRRKLRDATPEDLIDHTIAAVGDGEPDELLEAGLDLVRAGRDRAVLGGMDTSGVDFLQHLIEEVD